MGVVIGIAIAISVSSVIIGLCLTSGRAELEKEIMRLRNGGR